MVRCAWFFLSCGLILSSMHQSSFAADLPVDFNRDIRPILSNNCVFCHGPDEHERKGGEEGSKGLRLDTEAGLTADLGGRAALVKGNAAASELIKRVISGDPDVVMPPPKTGKKLTAKEIELLRRWVNEGAKFSTHWSYSKPVRPAVPATLDAGWARNEIDKFLLKRLEQEGLKPQSEADRPTLIRRLSLDLTGLPPSVAEVDAFVKDASADAYDKLVDRLLEKQSFGEHWARMWLDLARYADSAGYADDPARTIWAYRDYLIRALNKNVPLDQMTIDQLAGDLLENPTEDQLIATAFHRNTQTNSEGGTNDEEFRNVAVVDRVNTTMAVWMGTTIACAQCHNHKYDPLSQKEFFQLFAFFNQSEDADRRDESPLLTILSPEDKARQKTLQDELVSLEKLLKTATPELQAAQSKWELSVPRDLMWTTPQPLAATSKSGAKLVINEGGAVLSESVASTDRYTIELPLSSKTLGAVRLETLPHDSLPGKGPGLGGGNFVLSQVTASITPPETSRLSGRYVRIELPGKKVFLALAEVQVFNGEDNIATKGAATQISTDYEGPAKLAIDGNTNGHYFEGKSVTHTAASDDPWWEVDLTSSQPIDRIAVWNRTDGGVNTRLSNFKISVLDDARKVVWEQVVKEHPKPSSTHPLSGVRSVNFVAAFADYSQPMFDAANVIGNKDLAGKGWAVGGGTGAPHALMLVTAAPVEIVPGSKLTINLEHASKFEKHLLGHFRIGVTDDARAAEFVKTPSNLIALIRKPSAERTAADQTALTDYFLTTVSVEQQPIRDKVAVTKKQLADIKPITVPVMRELAAAAQRKTRLQHRGNFMDLGDEVTAAVPAVWHQLPEGAPRNRLTLAKWLIDAENPLTGRVVVNRYWEKIFGNGIVLTAEEFGAQGDLPFHPELLDWLAVEFTTNLKWDTKRLIKLLVSTAAYRQISKVDEALYDRDPENRLLARGPRFRMTAETVRDQALFVSGLLSPKMYGPPVKPLQPSLGVSAAFGAGIDWATSEGEDRYRRGLYTNWRRSNPYPSMATFDAPNREVCLLRRPRTNTPLQALVTLNDPVYIEAAQSLGRRIVAEGGATLADQVRYGFKLCLSREPNNNELARLVKLHAEAVERFAKTPNEAMTFATKPVGPIPQGADVVNLAAWTVVSNVLLNLDEVFMAR